MYRKVLLGGVTAAVIAGTGTAAIAVSGSGTTGGSATSSSTAHKHGTGKHKPGRLLRRAVHGKIVVKTKQGYVTHDLIRGTVAAVSPTSITVVATDRTRETFTVTNDTKVRARANGKGAPSTIAAVAKGDHVFVAGTGTGTPTAKHVVDVKK